MSNRKKRKICANAVISDLESVVSPQCLFDDAATIVDVWHKDKQHDIVCEERHLLCDHCAKELAKQVRSEGKSCFIDYID